MNRDFLLKQDDHICQNIGHCHVIALVAGFVLYLLIVNDVSLDHGKSSLPDSVCLQVFTYCHNGVFVQIGSEHFPGSQL